MKKNSSILSKLYTLIIYIFLYLPIVVLVLFSFNESKLNAVWTGFSLKWYNTLFSDYTLLQAVKNSLFIGFTSSIVAVVIGTLAAVGMYRYKFKGKSVIDGMLHLPIVIPEIVMGISLLAFFSIVHVKMGMTTLILAHITFSIAYVVVVIRARLEGFDRALEEAAMDLGATPWQTFFKITIPTIMPGIVAGGLLAFTLSLDDVIISFFVSGPDSTTLPIKIFSMVKLGVTPEINALSTILMVFTITIVVLSEKLKNQKAKDKKVMSMFALIALIFVILASGVYVASKGNVAQKPEELNIYTWSEYIPDSVVAKFEKQYNVRVNVSTVSSNEELLAKIMAGGSQYDLAVASDYMVQIMANQGIIQPLDRNELTNFSNIGSQYKGLYYDSTNTYSMPYFTGNVVMVVNTDKIKFPVTSYKDLWRPELKNSLVVLDDQRIMIGATLKMLGYSFNETSDAALDKAKDALIKLQSNIKAYDSESPKNLMINGEASIGYFWGPEASIAVRENPKLKIVIPEEGMLFQQDNFVVPKVAKNPKLAQQFINFIMQSEIAAETSEIYPYPTTNIAAYPLMNPDKLTDVAVYPPEDEVKRAEYIKDIGDAIKKYDLIWSEIKQ